MSSESLEREEERLRDAIRRDSEGLRQAVGTLQSVAAQRFSLRNSIEQQPLAWLSGALLLGLWMGSRTR
jgi:hypothetical protein